MRLKVIERRICLPGGSAAYMWTMNARKAHEKVIFFIEVDHLICCFKIKTDLR